jgi:hypothetical protein
MLQNDIKIKEIQIPNAILIPEIVRMLDEGHTVTLPLKGFSMRPYIEDGRDKALLTKCKSPHVGDVVLAETSKNHFVLHRIIKIYNDIVILRGDGNLLTEECKLSDVKGFALGFYRKGRKKIEKTNTIKWRTYSFIWMKLFPIRRYLLAFYRRIWLKVFKPI